MYHRPLLEQTTIDGFVIEAFPSLEEAYRHMLAEYQNEIACTSVFKQQQNEPFSSHSFYQRQQFDQLNFTDCRNHDFSQSQTIETKQTPNTEKAVYMTDDTRMSKMFNSSTLTANVSHEPPPMIESGVAEIGRNFGTSPFFITNQSYILENAMNSLNGIPIEADGTRMSVKSPLLKAKPLRFSYSHGYTTSTTNKNLESVTPTRQTIFKYQNIESHEGLSHNQRSDTNSTTTQKSISMDSLKILPMSSKSNATDFVFSRNYQPIPFPNHKKDTLLQVSLATSTTDVLHRCENCGREHCGGFASGRFCSSKCARTIGGNARKRQRLEAQGIRFDENGKPLDPIPKRTRYTPKHNVHREGDKPGKGYRLCIHCNQPTPNRKAKCQYCGQENPNAFRSKKINTREEDNNRSSVTSETNAISRQELSQHNLSHSAALETMSVLENGTPTAHHKEMQDWETEEEGDDDVNDKDGPDSENQTNLATTSEDKKNSIKLTDLLNPP